MAVDVARWPSEEAFLAPAAAPARGLLQSHPRAGAVPRGGARGTALPHPMRLVVWRGLATSVDTAHAPKVTSLEA